MKLKMLFRIALLLVLSVGSVQATEKITTLYQIGEHAVYRPSLQTKADLRDMMRSDRVWNDIAQKLEQAECPGTATGYCSELIGDIYALFYQDFNADNFRDVQYDKDSVIFRWMMFRSQGEGRIKIAENINWGGAEPLPAYEFDIVSGSNTYTFAVPKGCGNLALLKQKECPVNPCAGCSKCIDCQTKEIYDTPKCRACRNAECFIPVEVNLCRDCDDCSPDCKIKGSCDTDKPECQICWDKKCFIPVEIKVTVNPCEENACNQCSTQCAENPYAKGCPEQCLQCRENGCLRVVTIHPCKENGCDQCPDECVDNPYAKGCPQQCLECRDRGCFRVVNIPKPVNVCAENNCDRCSARCADDPDAKGCPEQCRECKDEGCLRVVKVSEPFNVNVCQDKGCNQCSAQCADNPYGEGCPEQCRECKDEGCFRVVRVPDPFNLCEDKNCNQCPDRCVKDPYAEGCPEQCRECRDNGCLRVVTETETIKVYKNPCQENVCNQCSNECAENPYAEGCPAQCQQCKAIGCLRVVKEPVNICTENNCDQCSAQCVENPEKEGCPSQCRECRDEGCLRLMDRPLDLIADLGYFRQSDPADYLFGRVGIDFKLFPNDPERENISLLTMIGVAPKIGGSDGDSAFLLDVIAQYDWLQSFDSWSFSHYRLSLPTLRGFTGLGLGGWFTSGDVENDSEDSDLDIIANIGVKLPNNPDISVFLEMRNAIDELDDISEYGRFGAGVRFRF